MIFSRNTSAWFRLKGGLALVPAAMSALFVSTSSAQELKFSELPSRSSSNVQPASLVPALLPPAQGVLEPNLKSPVQSVNFEARVTPTATYRLVSSKSCLDFENALLTCWLKNPQAEIVEDGKKVLVEIQTKTTPMLMTIDRETSTLHVQASPSLAKEWKSLVTTIDTYQPQNQNCLLLVESLNGLEADLIGAVSESFGAKVVPTSAVFMAQEGAANQDPLPGAQPQDQAGKVTPGTQIVTRTTDEQGKELTGPVRIQVFPELDAIVIYGPPQDVEKVKQKISEFMLAAKETSPKFKRIPLEGADPQTTADTVQSVYDDNYSQNLGAASVRAIQDPRGLLVIGREEAIKVIEGLAKEYDVPEPTKPVEPNFKAFKLKFISAADAKTRIDQYFSQLANSALAQPGTPIPVITIADFRSNTLLVKGAKANFEQVEQLLKELDVDESLAENMVRVFALKNTLADQVAVVLQDAINGQQQNAGKGFTGTQQNNLAQQQQNQLLGGQNQSGSQLRSPSLRLMTVDRDGNKVGSGIMFDVRVTSNASNNSVIVSAPESAMPLIASLIEQLDTIPKVETQIKVFQIINGDAQTLLSMMQTLFTGQAQQGAAQGGVFGQAAGGATTSSLQLPAQSAAFTEGMTLANMRFAYDQRTNSIIVTGPVGDLEVVESLLTRLDEQELNRRLTVVLRLSNAPVADVAESVQAWLDSRLNNITSADPTYVSALVKSRRFVIVQPEIVSNQMIVSALPEYLEEVVNVIRSLDRRPPMLKIKVILAEVNLSMLEEFGVDLGVQDSLLFDRGLAGVGGNGRVGFPFNTSAIGNDNSPLALAGREKLAGQALSNLGVGRSNAELAYGGLVLSAGNESINILLRALQDKNCARILDKPHIMTIENQQGRFQSGATVARVGGSTNTNSGVTQDINDVDVGVIIEVTPRVSQDGMIVMYVDAQKSALSNEGVEIPTQGGGSVLSPNINKVEVQSTVMARSGQTVVLSGLISEEKTKNQHGTPFLSSLPLVGPLFRFESEQDTRKELLIIMTPMLVDSEEDLEAVNTDEMDRMHWCLSDVAEVYGSTNYDPNPVYHSPKVFYPDVDPLGMNPQFEGEGLEVPVEQPTQQNMPPQPGGGQPQATNAAQTNRAMANVERKTTFTSQSQPADKTTLDATPASFKEELTSEMDATPRRSFTEGFKNYLPQKLRPIQSDAAAKNGLNTEIPGYRKNPYVEEK